MNATIAHLTTDIKNGIDNRYGLIACCGYQNSQISEAVAAGAIVESNGRLSLPLPAEQGSAEPAEQLINYACPDCGAVMRVYRKGRACKNRRSGYKPASYACP